MIVTAGSTEKIRRCLELGADRAVNYKTEDVVAAIRDFVPQGVDVYWDTTHEPDFERSVPLVRISNETVVLSIPSSPFLQCFTPSKILTIIREIFGGYRSFGSIRRLF